VLESHLQKVEGASVLPSKESLLLKGWGGSSGSSADSTPNILMGKECSICGEDWLKSFGELRLEFTSKEIRRATPFFTSG